MFSLQPRVSILMAGSGLLLAATYLTSQSQSISKVETPHQVADVLDCVFQPRFQKDEIGFGLSRIMTISGHEKVARFTPQDENEKRLMAKVQTAGREYVVAFLHCAHVPGRYPEIRDAKGKVVAEEQKGSASLHPHLTSLFASSPGKEKPEMLASRPLGLEGKGMKNVEKVVIDALPKLKKGKDVEADSAKWLVVMRPVTASQDSCLKCHTGAKAGDTLGVMVYAVSKTKTKVAKADTEGARFLPATSASVSPTP
jgi:hypothetical protein